MVWQRLAEGNGCADSDDLNGIQLEVGQDNGCELVEEILIHWFGN